MHENVLEEGGKNVRKKVFLIVSFLANLMYLVCVFNTKIVCLFIVIKHLFKFFILPIFIHHHVNNT